MLGILQQDAFAHPVVDYLTDPAEGKKSKKKGKKRMKSDVDIEVENTVVPPPDEPLDYISGEKLDEAKRLLETEAQITFDEKAKELRASSDS